MQPTNSSLFEAEMRDQVASALARVVEAVATGDAILIDSARGHLDGLVSLASRNGLDVGAGIPTEPDLTLEPALDMTEQPAAS